MPKLVCISRELLFHMTDRSSRSQCVNEIGGTAGRPVGRGQ